MDTGEGGEGERAGKLDGPAGIAAFAGFAVVDGSAVPTAAESDVRANQLPVPQAHSELLNGVTSSPSSSTIPPKGVPASLKKETFDSYSPPQPINPLQLHLRSHPSRGRGVFTDSAIPAGTLIEESPVLLLSQREWDEGKMNGTILGEYGFCWSDGGMAIGLGLGKSVLPALSGAGCPDDPIMEKMRSCC